MVAFRHYSQKEQICRFPLTSALALQFLPTQVYSSIEPSTVSPWVKTRTPACKSQSSFLCCTSNFYMLDIPPTHPLNIFCPVCFLDGILSWYPSPERRFMYVAYPHFSALSNATWVQYQSFSFVSSWILPGGPAIPQIKLLAGPLSEDFVL